MTQDVRFLRGQISLANGDLLFDPNCAIPELAVKNHYQMPFVALRGLLQRGFWKVQCLRFEGGNAPQNSPVTQVSASLLVGGHYSAVCALTCEGGIPGRFLAGKRKTLVPSKIPLAKISLVQRINMALRDVGALRQEGVL